MKHFIFKTLLRCKYHVGFTHKRHWLRKYFWRLESARKFADSIADGKTAVWRRDYKRVYVSTPDYLIDCSTHEDAKNFSTNI